MSSAWLMGAHHYYVFTSCAPPSRQTCPLPVATAATTLDASGRVALPLTLVFSGIMRIARSLLVPSSRPMLSIWSARLLNGILTGTKIKKTWLQVRGRQETLNLQVGTTISRGWLACNGSATCSIQYLASLATRGQFFTYFLVALPVIDFVCYWYFVCFQPMVPSSNFTDNPKHDQFVLNCPVNYFIHKQ